MRGWGFASDVILKLTGVIPAGAGKRLAHDCDVDYYKDKNIIPQKPIESEFKAIFSQIFQIAAFLPHKAETKRKKPFK